MRQWLVENTNAEKRSGTLKEVLVGADVFIGVSAPNILDSNDIANMAQDAIVFGLANPIPEIDPLEAQQHAAVVATGRSDFPNQINNVLAFPGFFRGLLDGGLHVITDEMLSAAANAIANQVAPDELNASYIIPSVFDASVAPAVATAVREVGEKKKYEDENGLCRKKPRIQYHGYVTLWTFHNQRRGIYVRKNCTGRRDHPAVGGLLSPERERRLLTRSTPKSSAGPLHSSGVLQRRASFPEPSGRRQRGHPRLQARLASMSSADYMVKEHCVRPATGSKSRPLLFRSSANWSLLNSPEVSPTVRDFETGTFTYSGSGDVTGRVIPTNDIVIPPNPTPPPNSTSGCEPADFPTPPDNHSIALIQRGTCTFGQKVANATAAGYAAVIIFNEGQPGRQDLTIGTLGSPQPTPTVGLSFADGEALYTESLGGPVTARVFTSTENDPNRETVNVIADTPEGKIKGQTIVVGAHLDSVSVGPGINDNGSGSASILEIAEQLAALKYTNKLQRQVRFAFWGAEELNLLGSQHYVDSLSEAQLLKIYANLNFDMVGSPNYVRFVYDGNGSDTPAAGPPGSDAIEEVFNKYFADQGLASDPTAFDGRSDYGPFIAVGIPAGGLFSGAEGIKTATTSRSLRRHCWCGVRPLLPPGVRHHQQPQLKCALRAGRCGCSHHADPGPVPVGSIPRR